MTRAVRRRNPSVHSPVIAAHTTGTRGLHAGCPTRRLSCALQGAVRGLWIIRSDDEAIAGREVTVFDVDVCLRQTLKHPGGRTWFVLARDEQDLLFLFDSESFLLQARMRRIQIG